MSSQNNPSEKKSHSRAPGMTQISISLPEELVDKVNRLATMQNRSRSNFIANLVRNITEEKLSNIDESPHFQIAEPKKKFNDND